MSTPDTSSSAANDDTQPDDSHGSSDGQESAKFSPFAGCSIFIIAGLIGAGMIAFMIWSYFQTRDTIEGFTDEQAKVIEVADITDRESEQVSLKSKLVGFRHKIETGKEASMSLDANELNLAIATFEILKPHRTKLFIQEIKDNNIRATISFPTKSRMRSDSHRFINAQLTIQPELVDGAAFPRITRIQPDREGNTEIPEQFKQFISETLLKPLYDDKELGPVFQGLSSVEIKGSQLVLHTSPTALAEQSQEPDTDLAIDRLLKGFAVVALIFLSFVTLIIIISRRKAKQA